MSIADKLLTVANNTPAVAEAVNAAKTTVSGNTIRADDVLDVEHPLQVQLKSKNLLDYTKATGRIASQKVEIFEDGVLWKAGGDFYFYIPVSLPAGITVVCSWESGNEAGEYISNYRLLYTDNTYTSTLDTNGTKITSTKEVKGVYIYKATPATALTQDLLVSNIQLELGSTATACTPYTTDFEGVGVTVMGKNLLSALTKWGQTLQNTTQPIYMRKGQIYTFSHNGDYTMWRLMFYGTLADGSPFPYDTSVGGSQEASKYIQNAYTAITGDTTRLQHDNNKTGNSIQIVCNEEIIITGIQLCVTGTENTPYTEYQLEFGTIETNYEAYKEHQTATADSTGNVTGLLSVSPAMTLLTDNAGVSVECTYFPQSAEETYTKYQQLRQEQTALQKYIREE